MEIKQLEAFVAVVRLHSFSRAAEELYLSQSTVSAQVAALEKSVGAQLLLRTTKDIALTAAGRELYPYAHDILSLRGQALQAVSGGDRNAPGELHILSSTVPAQHLLPEIIAAFRRDWPNTVFHVRQTDSAEVLREMAGFGYDFGFIGTAPRDPRIVAQPVYRDRLVVAVPPTPAANSDQIRQNFPAFLREQAIILREEGSGTRAETEELFRALGVHTDRLRTAAYFADTHSILRAVAEGMGVAIVSEISASLYAQAGLITAVDMHSELFSRQIQLVHNRELRLTPLQQAFARYAVSFYNP